MLCATPNDYDQGGEPRVDLPAGFPVGINGVGDLGIVTSHSRGGAAGLMSVADCDVISCMMSFVTW